MPRAHVYVTYKPGVLDPQGAAVEGALKTLGHASVRGVRVGKFIEIDLSDGDPEELAREVEAMCRELLANPVIEDYRVELSH
ncbi:MAG: phosphoribosylformylglycinamidine synthase subunit PurS [Nitrospinota bacterium]